MTTTTKQQRLEAANELIATIASCGRRFFWCRERDRVASMLLDERGRAWFVDDWTGARVYVNYRGAWRGFSHGGTLRDLIERLRDFIARGEQLPGGVFGPWPEWICYGDLWGYGDDMAIVRNRAIELGIVEWAPAADASRLESVGQCAEARG